MVVKVDPEYQLAVYSMSLIGTPQIVTRSVLAPLVECAEKASMSIPAKHKVSLSNDLLNLAWLCEWASAT